jgi:hypothetical protein
MTGGEITDDRREMTDERREITDDRGEMTDEKGDMKEDGAKSLSSVICHLSSIPAKEQIFRTLLNHPAIKEIRSTGFLIAVQLENADICVKVCHECVQAGIVTDWFLFATDCLRIAPPLIISDE